MIGRLMAYLQYNIVYQRLKYLKLFIMKAKFLRLFLAIVILGSIVPRVVAKVSAPASPAAAMEDSITKIYHNLVGCEDSYIPGIMDLGRAAFQRAIFVLEELPSDECKWLWDPMEY